MCGLKAIATRLFFTAQRNPRPVNIPFDGLLRADYIDGLIFSKTANGDINGS
jgi:hypothetical protein